MSQSCIKKCSLQSLTYFLPHPFSLPYCPPTPQHIFLCTETIGISKLSLLCLGRQVWKRPPSRLEHKVAAGEPEVTHGGWFFQLFSAGSGLELCSQLCAADSPGRALLGKQCWAGARWGLWHSTALPGKCFEYGGREQGISATCTAGGGCRALKLPVMHAVFRVYARTCHRGTGKAVKKCVAMLKPEKLGQPSVGQYYFNTHSISLSLSTPCLLDIISIHKANETHSVCVCVYKKRAGIHVVWYRRKILLATLSDFQAVKMFSFSTKLVHISYVFSERWDKIRQYWIIICKSTICCWFLSVVFLCDLNIRFTNLSFFPTMFSQSELLKNVKYIILLALTHDWVSELFCTCN